MNRRMRTSRPNLMEVKVAKRKGVTVRCEGRATGNEKSGLDSRPFPFQNSKSC